MSGWPRYPTIYEINPRVWLSELSERVGDSVNLSSVPPAEWDAIAKFRFDGVWLMGIWERSPAGIAIANRNNSLLDDFKRALPDFRPQDNVGSAYCVRRYSVNELLGGPEGLAVAKATPMMRRTIRCRSLRWEDVFLPVVVTPTSPHGRMCCN